MDFFAFDVEQARLIGQMPTAWQQSHDARLRLPEGLQDIEQIIKDVQTKRDELANIPRYKRASVEEYEEVQKFRRAAGKYWDEQRELSKWVPDSVAQQYRSYNSREGHVDRKILNLAIFLRGNNAKRNRDPRYNDFLLDNADVLKPFYPSLYTNELLQQLGRR